MTPSVAVFTCEEWHSACAHLRVRSPLRAAGYTAVIGHALPEARLDLDCIEHAGSVLIQRDFPRHAAYSQVVEAARAHGKPVVFDIDDVLWDMPDDHPAYGKYRDARHAILDAIFDADIVTTTTEPLAARLRLLNPNTQMLPNYLDEQLWPSLLPLPLGGTSPTGTFRLWEERARVRGDAVRIGYLGSGTHRPDLEMIAPALAQVQARLSGRVEWVFFGDAPPNALAGQPNVKHQAHFPDYAQFAKWLQGQRWDIAIAPLRDTAFNRCKSAVKFLEYSAAGAAGVYSNLAPYRSAVEHGRTGLLAQTEQDWVEHLTSLITDDALRHQVARAAQASVAANCRLTQHAHLWREVCEEHSQMRSERLWVNEMPGVSAIVLNHNGQAYLDDCLGSLQRLDYAPGKLEIVVADNGSTDDSLALVRQRYPDARVVAFESNLGFCGGYNRAIAACNTGCVALLNNDMRVEPDWLIQLVRGLQGEQGAVCAGSKILNWDGTAIDFAGHEFSPLGHAGSIGHGETALDAHDGRRYLLAASAGAMLINRQAFLDAGGFDESYFAYYEDFDLGWRLWILGHKVVFAPRSVAYHRHSGTSSRIPAPKVAYLYERNTLSTIIKNYEQPYLDKVLPAALMLRTQHAYLAGERAGLNMAQARMTPGALPATTSQQQIDPSFNAGYYARRSAQALQQHGALGLARKAVDELDRRRGQRPPQPLQDPSLLAGHLSHADINEFLQQEALWQEQAQLTAVSDVIGNLDALMAQRATLQSKRRRSDADIFALTQCVTLRPWFGSPEYARAHQAVLAAFGIDRLFDAGTPQHMSDE